MNITDTFPLRFLSRLPSAWLLIVQLLILVLAPLTNDSITSHAISWGLSALGLSTALALGYGSKTMQVAAHLVEAIAYFYASQVWYPDSFNTTPAEPRAWLELIFA
jgi:hypothetical protein